MCAVVMAGPGLCMRLAACRQGWVKKFWTKTLHKQLVPVLESGVLTGQSLVVVCRDSALSLKMTFGALNESKHFPDCVCSTAKLIWS